MKIPESLKTESVRHAFEAAFIIVLLLIIPSLPLGKFSGGIAMLACSAIGLVLYFILFRERFRDRLLLKTAALAAIVGAVIAVAVSLLSRWRSH